MNVLHKLTLAQAQQHMIDSTPQCKALGFQLVEFGQGRLTIELPYSEMLIGDPETRVMHGGAITTLVDSACGFAVLTGLRSLRRCATLDLRIDYLRPARPGMTVHCTAECYRITHEIAFVRASAHDGDPNDLLATASGTFALFEELFSQKAAKRDGERGATV